MTTWIRSRSRFSGVLLGALLAITGFLAFGHRAEATAPPAGTGEPFIGEVRLFGGNFAPRGWALCDGQLLSIQQNTALFSILGVTYGGDGRTTFGLPDLRGRVALHPGTGTTGPTYELGQSGGAPTVTLQVDHMPAHNHEIAARNDSFDTEFPFNSILSASRSPAYSTLPADSTLRADSVSNTGGGLAHENMTPYLGVNHIIALVGVFPSEN